MLTGFRLLRNWIWRWWLARIIMGTAIRRFSVLVERQNPMRHFGISDIKRRFVEAMACRWTTGRGRGGWPHGLRIQMNDDPPEVVLAQHIVRPDDWCDGFRTATNTGDDVLPNIRIETFRALGRIMQASDRESDGDGKADTVVADRFLQDDKSPGVFLFMRYDTTEGDFPPESIERFLRIEDRGFDAEHFELLQVAATGVAHSDECR